MFIFWLSSFFFWIRLWNSLPVALRDTDISLVQFKRLLKTLWFVRAAAHNDCCFFVLCTHILTYLLTTEFFYDTYQLVAFRPVVDMLTTETDRSKLMILRYTIVFDHENLVYFTGRNASGAKFIGI